MAVKKSRKTQPQPKMIEEVTVKEVEKPVNKTSRLMVASWTLLLVAGLGHMMPTQLAPILNWSVAGVSVQMAIGVLSVVAALYYLLEE